jgi:hypothetical protein
LLHLLALIHHVTDDLDDGLGFSSDHVRVIGAKGSDEVAQLRPNACVRGSILADGSGQATGEGVHGLAQVGHAGGDVLSLVRAVRREVAARATEIPLGWGPLDAQLLTQRDASSPAVALGPRVFRRHVVGIEGVLTESAQQSDDGVDGCVRLAA